jgi:hypothetical protein
MVPRCHDGVDGSECTARWVSRVIAGHCPGYVLHMLHSTYLSTYVPRYSVGGQVAHPVRYPLYHCTPGRFLFIIPPLCRAGVPRAPRTVCAAASISAQVGWRAAATTRTKEGASKERASEVLGLVLYHGLYPVRWHLLCVSQEVCLLTLHLHLQQCGLWSRRLALGLLAYKHGKSTQYITPTTHAHPAHTRPLSGSPPSSVMAVSLLQSIGIVHLMPYILLAPCSNRHELK